MNNNTFRKVSASKSNIDDKQLTYGMAWGDLNEDGYLDLWVNNHQQPGSLYINQKNGTFRDVTANTFVTNPDGDEHGTAWVDYDNDGDLDLINVVGSAQGAIGSFYNNRFYVNEGGKLKERAVELGIEYSLARATSLLWLDYNNDGRLDLIVGSTKRPDGIKAPTKVFLQGTDGKFTDATESTGQKSDNDKFFILSDLSGDGNLDLISSGDSVEVYDTRSLPFKKITDNILPKKTKASDLVSADFNGDLKPDLFLANNNNAANELARKDADSIISRLWTQQSEKGIKFKTEGAVKFKILGTDEAKSIPLDRIYIGKTGKTVEDFGFNFPNSQELDFTLSPDNPDVRGILPHTAGKDTGIYIGYNADRQSWQLLLSSDANNSTIPQKNSLLAFIDAVEPISQLKRIGFNINTVPPENQLFLSSNSGLVDRTSASGIDKILAQSQSAVAGDFDNDMDEDLFVVTSTKLNNTADILYENQGNGNFVAVSKGGGAKGTNLGIGDIVTTVDYDNNGFLDLLVGNHGEDSASPLTDNLAYELFQNQGNDNNWLQIDLQGIKSNRDGVGARVLLKAGGKTKMRQQTGGMHNDIQNSQRIHFGLAKNTRVDELVIQWPSGTKQVVEDLPVNRIIKVVESLNGSDNSFFGGSSNDVVNGAKGNDTIQGKKGNDILSGKVGNDLLNGGIGDDLLQGGVGKDTLRGLKGNDILRGEAGNDILNGGDGSDLLIGGNGFDTIIGGAGSDRFRFYSLRNGVNKIEDFNPAKDKIEFSAANFGGGLTAGAPITDAQFQLGAVAKTAACRFLYDSDRGGLFFDRDGKDATFDPVRLAVLPLGLDLTEKNIVAIA
jgi:Ca2+-binding RTX toxin-like protein